jgi:transposase-like protein
MNDPSQEETITGLKSIWEDEHVTKLPIIDGGQRQWKCLWCNNTFNQWNSTKAIYHLNRVKGYSIKVCRQHHPSSYFSDFNYVL